MLNSFRTLFSPDSGTRVEVHSRGPYGSALGGDVVDAECGSVVETAGEGCLKGKKFNTAASAASGVMGLHCEG